MLRKLMGLCLLMSVASCGSNIGGIKSACAVFPAPSWSSKDTPETQAWFDPEPPAVGYAAKWTRTCGKIHK